MPKQSKARHNRTPLAIPPGTYLCECILDLKIERGQRHYLIKWKGYDDPNDNTWEPLCNVENLIQDLIIFEEEHSSRIRKQEEQWRQKYRKGDVSEPLQELDIEILQQKLDRFIQLSNTPESSPPPPKRTTHKDRKEKKDEKAKQIGKKKRKHSLNHRETRSSATISMVKEQYKRQEREEEKIQAKHEVKNEKEIMKRRARITKKPIISPKIKEQSSEAHKADQSLANLKCDQQDDSQMVDNVDNKDIVSQYFRPQPQANIQSNSESHRFLTPERNILVPEDGKKTSSQERGFKCEQEHSDDQIYHESPERPFLQHSMVDQGYFDRQQLNNQINSYFDNFSQEKSVSQMLSKRLTPPTATVNQLFPVPLAEEAKRQSIFKNLGTKYPQSSRAAPLNPINKKYMIYRKRKSPMSVDRSESDSQSPSQSQSQRSILKSLPNNPIIELQEEQKESSPVGSNHNRIEQANQVHENKEKTIKEMQQESSDRIIRSEQPLQMVANVVHIEEAHPMRKMNKEEEQIQEEQEKSRLLVNEGNQLNQEVQLPDVIGQEEQIENHIQQKNQDASIEHNQRINNNQEDNHAQVSKHLQIENVNAILDHFQRHNDGFIGVEIDPKTPPTNRNGKKKEEPIEIGEDSPKENRKSAHPQEGQKFYALPIKTKRIKKQVRQQGLRRGIVGRSQESLVQDGQKLHYRPSLNTVLQGLLSEGELKLLSGPPKLCLCSNFRMENVIIFSAQVLTSNPEPQTRFISYQTLRECYPRELLTFLEEQGMIEL